jgi:hypothetical protein
LQFLDVDGHDHGLDVGQGEVPLLEPIEEPEHGPVVGSAEVGIPDVGGEELEEPTVPFSPVARTTESTWTSPARFKIRGIRTLNLVAMSTMLAHVQCPDPAIGHQDAMDRHWGQR